MTKPTKWCAQRRLRSAWASAQSDQSSLCTRWVAKDPSFPHADSEDSDQTGRMPRLIWVFAGRTCHFVGFVMRQLKWRWSSSKLSNCHPFNATLTAKSRLCNRKHGTTFMTEFWCWWSNFIISDVVFWTATVISRFRFFCSPVSRSITAWWWFCLRRRRVTSHTSPEKQ